MVEQANKSPENRSCVLKSVSNNDWYNEYKQLRMMTSQFLSEANKLKNIQVYLEKNDNFINNLSKYNWDLFDYIINLEKERTREINDRTYCELKEIWKLLNSSRKFLQKSNVNTIDLTSFKKGMVNLQDKIQALKSRLLANTELLKEQERSLLEFNDLYNQKILEWEKPTKLTTNNCRKISSELNHKTSEVEDFMDFVFKSNGHENGWSSEDHQLFLKFRKKYKNIEDLAINLNKILPDISTDDVKDHEMWWRQYLHLKQKKKDAIERWQSTKARSVPQKEVNDIENGNNDDGKSMSKMKVTDENIREKLARWKAEKEAKKHEEANMNQMKKEELKRLEEHKRAINTHIKELVKRWRTEKIIKQEDEKIHKELVEYQEKRIRETEANKMIKHFQSRDDIFIARMRSKKRKEVNLTTKRSKSSYLARRDPERIFKPTKQWTIKISKQDDLQENVHHYVPNVRYFSEASQNGEKWSKLRRNFFSERT